MKKKLCENCEFFQVKVEKYNYNSIPMYFCTHEKSIIKNKAIKEKYLPCGFMRRKNSPCGVNAKLFKQKGYTNGTTESIN